MLTVASVSVAYGEQVVLDAASLSIQPGARIALCGANGSGKSTLLRIAAGLNRPDSGSVNVASSTRVAYLPQSGVGPADGCVGDELRRAFEEQLALESELRRVEDRLAEERDEAKIEGLLVRYQELVDVVGTDGEREREVALAEVLSGLGFAGDDAARECTEFSSGWQMRIALGRVLLRRADILLLDEPSNYLDLDARQWLERYLRDYEGAYAIVAHDRELLDRTCDEVVEVYRGSLTRYPCSFSTYLERRQAELDEMARRYEEQQQEIARIESFVRKYRANASKARMVQSRVKYLERLPRLEPPPVQSKVAFHFPPAPRSGRVVVAAEELSVSYGERRVLSEVSVAVERGDRLALVGSNGVGKSTLLRALVGAVPAHGGSVRFGTSVEVGYFTPEGGGTTQVGAVQTDAAGGRGTEAGGSVLGGSSLVADLAGSRSVLELTEALAPRDMVPHVRSLLGAFLFRGDEVYKQLGVLSGGERSRVALVRLLLSPTNLLLLDEPTSHLDLSAIAVLADALSHYEGSMLFISHDEYFNAKLASKVVRVDDSGARLYPGDWEYYTWKREQELGDTGGGDPPAGAAGRVAGDRATSSGNGSRRRSGRRSAVREEELMRSLERLEARAAEIHEELGRPDVLRDGSRSRALKRELEANAAEQTAVTQEWEEAHHA